MANHNPKPPPVSGQFKPGVSGNLSGGIKGLLTRAKVELVMGHMAGQTLIELKAIVEDPKSPALNVIAAKLLIVASETGDHSKFDSYLNRTIGKVKDHVEVSAAVPFIIRRPSGETVELGVEPLKEIEE